MADGYGSQDPDGNWDGLVGELVNRYKGIDFDQNLHHMESPNPNYVFNYSNLTFVCHVFQILNKYLELYR